MSLFNIASMYFLLVLTTCIWTKSARIETKPRTLNNVSLERSLVQEGLLTSPPIAFVFSSGDATGYGYHFVSEPRSFTGFVSTSP